MTARFQQGGGQCFAVQRYPGMLRIQELVHGADIRRIRTGLEMGGVEVLFVILITDRESLQRFAPRRKVGIRDCRNQAGIQPAGNSDHQRFRVGVADALFKPMCLHCEDIFAALVGLRRGIRNERSAAHYSGKLCGLYFHIERNTAHPRAQTSHEASVAAALGSKLLDVYFSNGQPG